MVIIRDSYDVSFILNNKTAELLFIYLIAKVKYI
jgi:hypothetical protein